MSLACLTLGLLVACPARAQWVVTDQVGDAISANPDGSGYPLRGPLTGSATPSGAYQDLLTANQQPNPPAGYAFIPNPNDYQGWLFSSGATPPGGGYNPYAVWTTASAYNDAGTSGGTTGYLGKPWNENINGSITANVGGTLWAVFQWQPPYPGIMPPDHINILLRTTVSASASLGTYGSPPQTSGLSASATATDSTFGETASAPSGTPLVTGRHLLRVPVDPNTHKAQVSLGGTATATASDSVPYGAISTTPPYVGYYYTTNGPTGASASASIGATAAFDSREVHILPPLGTTYHKGANAQPVANVPDPYTGLLTDDTVTPKSGISSTVNHQAVAGGSWNPNSSYAWSQMLQTGGGESSQYDSNSARGTLPATNITPPFSVIYRTQNRLTSVATSHVSILVTDSGDGATASNDYFLNFHNEYENFIKLTDVRQSGPWTRVSPDAVSGPNGGPFPLPINISVSVTASVDPSGAAGSAVAAQYGVAVGTTYSTAVPRSGSKWQMGRNKHNWIIDQVFWEQMTGTVDNYEGQGYVQQISWSLNKPYNASNPLKRLQRTTGEQ